MAAADAPLASFTWRVNVPAAVGVPVMAPVVGIQRQAVGQSAGYREGVGRGSAADHRGGAVQGTPASPEVTAGQVSDGGGAMVKGHVVVAAAPVESLT